MFAISNNRQKFYFLPSSGRLLYFYFLAYNTLTLGVRPPRGRGAANTGNSRGRSRDEHVAGCRVDREESTLRSRFTMSRVDKRATCALILLSQYTFLETFDHFLQSTMTKLIRFCYPSYNPEDKNVFHFAIFKTPSREIYIKYKYLSTSCSEFMSVSHISIVFVLEV